MSFDLDLSKLSARLRPLLPGVLVAVVVAASSRFLSIRIDAPAMLLALLLGMAMKVFADDPRCEPGIAFAARTLLRLGVAMLGLRISFEMIGDLGWPVVALVVGAVPATILFGLSAARFFGFRYRFAFLSAGAVAICGASAAMAIAAVLPRDERSDERLVFTVVGVTVLSTAAMVIYPLVLAAFSLSDVAAGIYLGATIHDVAQVVGAGFSVSETAGETATLVKLLRVAMLGPVVVAAVLVLRLQTSFTSEARPSYVPSFVVAFVLLAALNSTVSLPEFALSATAAGSDWLLLTAIAAVGVKTRPAAILRVGQPAIALLVGETLFLAAFVAVCFRFLGPMPA
ncbi:MAG: putative sulfate exporter family transporter [Pseudomonadota bacterium]